MDGLELISFQIIAAVGTARSNYIEAMEVAIKGDIEKAEALIKEGEEEFVEAHTAHGELITKEASGEPTQVNLLLMHAEDQLMSAETVKIVALQMIELLKSLKK